MRANSGFLDRVTKGLGSGKGVVPLPEKENKRIGENCAFWCTFAAFVKISWQIRALFDAVNHARTVSSCHTFASWDMIFVVQILL